MARGEPVAADAPVYVALGDSISIDEYAGGPGRGAASLLARNLDAEFPQWRGRDLASIAPRTRFHPLATDGGTSCTVLDRQLPRLVALGVTPTVVTLTAGGNDVLGAYGDTPRARAVITGVREDIGTALAALRCRMRPDDPIIVGTVYDPSDGTGDSSGLGLPPWPDGVGVLAELNAALVGVAADHGALVADIHRRFLGHGVLAGSPSQPSPRPAARELWYCNVIEPNAWGAGAVREAFWEALGRQPPGRRTAEARS